MQLGAAARPAPRLESHAANATAPVRASEHGGDAMNRRPLRCVCAALLLTCAIHAVSAWSATTGDCAGILKLSLGDTTVVTAERVAGPSFTPPGATAALGDLPAF